ncbi:DsbA family oxidoreductase [Actinomadura logoneensis]|uniref:DsbA family oxidoreductase n=1 Tax=Actinomadura logoneensis TaxID=2293572 RepID=A0A372JN44_9ACTN|nr:DsbA family oxidoreductase [Actinomadura logoneensis]RFU41451.1 DsbA family oxidoreductase [Actinomadura logoneensis]
MKVRIEMTQDIACAWSALAHARLENALERFRAGGGEAEVVYRPFQIVPDAPPDGEPLSEVHRRVFGPEAERNTARMTALAARDGFTMRFDRAVFANTLDAHRLVATAALHGRGEEAAGRLFRAYFQDGLNVAAPDVLARLAGELGVPWAPDGDSGEVRAAVGRVRAEGVTSVPRFVIGDRTLPPGAPSTDDLLAAMHDAARAA